MTTPKKNWLVFSDLHCPWHIDDAIQFLQKVQREWNCREEVICAGDLFDFHSSSFHTSETDALGIDEEYARAKKFVGELTKAFPKGVLVKGNHGQIPQRKMKEAGLSLNLLKESNDLYGLPKGWRVEPLYYVIPGLNVLVEHGIGSGGRFGAINTAIYKRCSYVQGHIHSAAGVMFSTNYSDTIFGLNCGCLCNEGSLALRYGQYNKAKGVLGCGVVESSSSAYFVKK